MVLLLTSKLYHVFILSVQPLSSAQARDMSIFQPIYQVNEVVAQDGHTLRDTRIPMYSRGTLYKTFYLFCWLGQRREEVWYALSWISFSKKKKLNLFRGSSRFLVEASHRHSLVVTRLQTMISIDADSIRLLNTRDDPSLFIGKCHYSNSAL